MHSIDAVGAIPTTRLRADDATPRLPERRRGALVFAELVCAIAIAAAASAALQAIVNRLSLPHPSYAYVGLTVVGGLACGVVLVIAMWHRLRRARVVLGWVLPAALSTIVQALRLSGTPFYLNGTGGDQFFRIQYLQRLASSPTLADGNYVHLDPYYPAGWFWIGGRFATLRGEPAWLAYKPFAIMTFAVAAAVVFVLWSLLVGRRRALVLAVVTALAGVTLDPYEPYAWLIMATVPAIGALAWRLLVASVRDRPAAHPWAATLLVGVFIGIAGAVYTLTFALDVLVVVLLAIASIVAAARPTWFGGRPHVEAVTASRAAGRALLRLVLVGLAALPIVLVVWAPYLVSWLSQPSAGNAAARFLPLPGATLSTPMLQFSISGACCLLGLGWIVFAWRRSHTAQALGVVVIACYLWQVLSQLALAAHTTLLSFNADHPLVLALWSAAVFGAIDVFRWLSTRLRPVHRPGLRALVSVLVLLGIVELAQTVPDSVKPLRSAAYAAYDDTGHTVSAPDATPDPTKPASYNGRLIAAIRKTSGRAPTDNVLLTSDFQLLDFRPYWGFQTSIQGYANPLARYPERNAEIREWGRATNPGQLLSGLATSPFPPPNVFVFTRKPDGLHTTISWDDFPRTDLNTYTDVVFHPEAFAGPRFHRMDIGPFTVIAVR